MNVEASLITEIQKALEGLFGIKDEKIVLQATRREFEGSHTFVTFPLTKKTKQKPEAIGEQIGSFLREKTHLVSSYNVVKGFLNLTIADEVWLEIFAEVRQDTNFGTLPKKDQKVMVEFSSPNTNKPLHLGHLRTNFLGFAMAQIFKANGYDVTKANLVNDRGIHICKSMLAYQKFGKGESPESSGIKGDHLVGQYYVAFDKQYKAQIAQLVEEGMDKASAEKEAPLMREVSEMLKKWEKGDEEVINLWKKMNSWVYAGFDQTYRKIGVSFDKIYYESDTYLLGKSIIEEGLSKNLFYQKEDGSVWIDLTGDKLDQKLLLRSDGTSVYMTQDLGTADLKYKDFSIDKSVYVVGNEQDYHFKVLFKILEKLQRPYAEGLYHMSYGMVDLPTGKMKSREGTVVDADDLVKEMIAIARKRTDELGKTEDFSQEDLEKLYHTIALGALKYYLLKVDPKKRMLFNPEDSIDFQGDAAPFIQYNFARISSILRRAKQESIDLENLDFRNYKVLQPSENKLLALILDLPTKIKEAAESYAPSALANYAYEVARAYSHFFAECSIFQAESEAGKHFRVALSEMTAKAIKRSTNLLGIDVPERM